MNSTLFAEVDQYIAHLFAPEDEALNSTIHSLHVKGFPQHSVSAAQGKFLHLMALLVRARRILEIGSLGGYSTIWLARALANEGKLISIEYHPEHAALARQNIARAGLAEKVEIITGKALDILPSIETSNAPPFDMIFIDADKPPYTEYFQWALRLSRPGTLIIADNVIREGKVLDAQSDDEKVQGVQRFNAMLAGCSQAQSIILQSVGAKEHDGMAIAVVG